MKSDGGPAFPVNVHCNDNGTSWIQTIEGMSLRDYFAAQAMGKMLPWNTEYPTEEIATRQIADHKRMCRIVAESAYLIADAMLAERAK